MQTADRRETAQDGESTTEDQHRDTSCWHVHVVVRVPRDGGGSLATDAARRLERADAVAAVTVQAVRGLEPALAATAAHLEARVWAREDVPADGLTAQLEDAPGTERVERVAQVQACPIRKYDPPP